MKLETKFMRLPMEVTIGSRFGDWKVIWGYWGKHRLYFLVMVVKLDPCTTTKAAGNEPSGLRKKRNAR